MNNSELIIEPLSKKTLNDAIKLIIDLFGSKPSDFDSPEKWMPASIAKKKDEKLRIYHKKQLNLYWLLIISDRLRGVREFNLPQQIENHEFHSHFQRVFLFDLMKPDIYQIV